MKILDPHTLVRKIVAEVSSGIVAALPELPPDWTEIEVRQFVAEQFQRATAAFATVDQQRAYESFMRARNLAGPTAGGESRTSQLPADNSTDLARAFTTLVALAEGNVSEEPGDRAEAREHWNQIEAAKAELRRLGIDVDAVGAGIS